MSDWNIALLTGLLFVAAVLYSSVGHAGASAYLAAMALFGVAPAIMKPTALVLNLVVATAGTIQFARAGHFEWKRFWPFAIASIPMALLGARIPLSEAYYRILLGLVLLFTAVRFAWPGANRDDLPTKLPHGAIAFVVGAFIGLLAGLTGTGGGIFLTPFLLLFRWAPAKPAAATSVAFILVNSFAGLIGLFLGAAPQLPAAIPIWGVAVLGGGLLGSTLGSRFWPGAVLRKLLAAVLLIASLKLLVG